MHETDEGNWEFQILLQSFLYILIKTKDTLNRNQHEFLPISSISERKMKPTQISAIWNPYPLWMCNFLKCFAVLSQCMYQKSPFHLMLEDKGSQRIVRETWGDPWVHLSSYTWTSRPGDKTVIMYTKGRKKPSEHPQ